jgi:hypothetical protein
MSKEVEPIYNDTSFLVLLFKAGLGIFITQITVLYLSSAAVESRVSAKYKNRNQERIVNKVLGADDDTAFTKPDINITPPTEKKPKTSKT